MLHADSIIVLPECRGLMNNAGTRITAHVTIGDYLKRTRTTLCVIVEMEYWLIFQANKLSTWKRAQNLIHFCLAPSFELF
mmetsp:Transcript_27359/g.84387  ORF Transcript_27359/g.84387 Transcript_27359/m.84387 type:complete len:80 (-) Transcript_27359:948-1187(-)